MSKPVGAAAVIFAALLAGCSAVEDAATTVGHATDKAGICVKALQLAGFTPSLANPEQTIRDARKTSEELTLLANQTPDAALKQALNDMSRRVGELGPANLTPAGLSEWTTKKVAAADAVTRACAS